MTPCEKTNGMRDPQIVPDDDIEIGGSVSKENKKKPKNVRPDSKNSLESLPDGKPLTVTTVVDRKKPQDLGKIIPKTKNVVGIKVEIRRTPGGPLERVKPTDLTKKSPKPDGNGLIDPKKPVEFVKGTTVTEVKVTFFPKNASNPMNVQLGIHACFEKKTTSGM